MHLWVGPLLGSAVLASTPGDEGRTLSGHHSSSTETNGSNLGKLI
jgi:hypothetical protein